MALPGRVYVRLLPAVTLDSLQQQHEELVRRMQEDKACYFKAEQQLLTAFYGEAIMHSEETDGDHSRGSHGSGSGILDHLTPVGSSGDLQHANSSASLRDGSRIEMESAPSPTDAADQAFAAVTLSSSMNVDGSGKSGISSSSNNNHKSTDNLVSKRKEALRNMTPTQRRSYAAVVLRHRILHTFRTQYPDGAGGTLSRSEFATHLLYLFGVTAFEIFGLRYVFVHMLIEQRGYSTVGLINMFILFSIVTTLVIYFMKVKLPAYFRNSLSS